MADGRWHGQWRMACRSRHPRKTVAVPRETGPKFCTRQWQCHLHKPKQALTPTKQQSPSSEFYNNLRGTVAGFQWPPLSDSQTGVWMKIGLGETGNAEMLTVGLKRQC